MEKDFHSFFAESKKVLQEYIQTRLDLLRVQTAIRASRILSAFFTIAIAALLFLLVLIFLGMAGGFWLGKLTGSNATGFLIVTGICLVLLIIAILLRKTFFTRPINNIMASLLEEETEEGMPDTENNATDDAAEK